MANRKVEDYAYRHSTSNRQAKRRLGKGSCSLKMVTNLPERGAPIPGTGKPKGASKG